MKSTKAKLLTVILAVLFALVLGITGVSVLGRGVTDVAAKADSSVTAYADEGEGLLPPDDGSAYASQKVPEFSYKSAYDSAFTKVNDGDTAIVTYNATLKHEFTFTNFDADIVSYTTTGADNSYWTKASPTVDASKKTITLYLAAGAPVGNYTVTFSLKNDTDTWADSGLNTVRTYSVRIDKKKIPVPEMYRENADGTKGDKVSGSIDNVEYSVNTYNYRIYNYDVDYVSFSKQGSSVYNEEKYDDKGIKYQLVKFPVANVGTAVATYWFDANIKTTAAVEWADGTAAANIRYGVDIQKCNVQAPAIATIDGKANTDTDLRTAGFTYDGKAHTVVLQPAISGVFNTPSVAGMGASFNNTTGELTLTVTNAGTYSFTLALASTTNFQWAGGGTANSTYTITVARKALDESEIKFNSVCNSSYVPTTETETIALKKDSNTLLDYHIEYDATTHYFNLSNITSDMFTTSDITNTSYFNFPSSPFDNANTRLRFNLTMYNDYRYNPVGEHSFYLTPGANYTWNDGGTNKRQVIIHVTKKRLELPKFVNGEHKEGAVASEAGILTENDTHITFYHTGANIFAYLNVVHSSGVIRMTPSGNTTGLSSDTASYSGETHYRLYASGINKYQVTYSLTYPAFCEWADADTNDGARGIVITFEIIAKAIKGNSYELYAYGNDSTRNSKNETKLTLDNESGGSLYYSVEWQTETFYYTLKGINESEMTCVSSKADSNFVWGLGWAASNTALNFQIGTSVDVNEAAYGYYITLTPKAGYSWDETGANSARYIYIRIKYHTIKGVDGDPTNTDIHGLYQLTDANYTWIPKAKSLVESTSENPTADLGYTYTVPFSTSARYYAISDFLSGMVTVTSNVTSKIPSPTTYGAKNDEVNGYIKFYIAANSVAGEVKLTITPAGKYAWPGSGRESRTVTIIIDKQVLTVPTVQDATGADVDTNSVPNLMTVTYTYNGTNQGFTLDNYVSGMTFSYSGFTVNSGDLGNGTYTFAARNAGTYNVNISIEGTKYKWSDGSEAATKTYRLIIKRKAINSVDHSLNFYGQFGDTDFTKHTTVEKSYTGPMEAAFTIVLDADLNYTFNRYYLLSITDLYDTTLGEAMVSVGDIPTGNYNSYFLSKPAANANTGNFNFWVDLYYYASWGAYLTYDHSYLLTPNANYCWETTTESAEQRTFYIKFQKRDIAVPSQTNPDSDNGYDETNRTLTVTYDGTVQHFKIYGDFRRINQRTASSGSSVTIDSVNNEYADFYATNVGTYTLSLSFSGSGYASSYLQWADYLANSSGTRVFTLIIKPQEVEIPKLYYTGRSRGADKETKLNDVTYGSDGRTVTLTYDSTATYNVNSYAWFTLFGCTGTQCSYYTYSGLDFVSGAYSGESANYYSWAISQRNDGVRTGTQTVTVSPGANYCWKDMGTNSKSNITFTIIINPLKIAVPEFKDFEGIACTNDGNVITIEYDGLGHTAVIPNALSAFYSNSGQGSFNTTTGNYDITATNAGDYSVTFAFRQSANTIWNDGINVTSGRTYIFRIKRKAIDLPKIVYYGNDSTCTSASIRSTTENNMTVMYDPALGNNYYFALENAKGINSTMFTEARQDGSYQSYSWTVKANSYVFWTIRYSSPFVRTAGWVFTLTPTANYGWDTGSGTVETGAKTFTIFMTKHQYEQPVYSETESTQGRFNANMLTVPYTGNQARLSFTGFYGDYMNVSYPSLTQSNHAVELKNEDGEGTGVWENYIDFLASASGEYTVTFSLKDGTYCEWAGGVAPIYKLKISNIQVDTPELYLLDSNGDPIKDNTNGDYPHYTLPLRSMQLPYVESGEYKFILSDYYEEYYSIAVSAPSGKTFKEVSSANPDSASGFNRLLTIDQANLFRGTYKITLTLKTNVEWKDGSRAAQEYYVEIMPIKVALPTLYDPNTGDRISSGTNELILQYDGTEQQFIFIPQKLQSDGVITSAFNTDNVLVCTGNAHNSGAQVLVATTVTIGDETVKGFYIEKQAISTYTYYLFLKNDCYIWDNNGGSYNTTNRQLKITIKGFELPKLEFYYNEEQVDPASLEVYAPYNLNQQILYFVLPEGYDDSFINYYSMSIYSGIFGAPKKATYTDTDAEGNSRTRQAFTVTVSPKFWRSDQYCYINCSPVSGHVWANSQDTVTVSYWFRTKKKEIKLPEFYIEVINDDSETTWVEIADGESRIYNGSPYKIMFKNLIEGEVTVASGGKNLIANGSTPWIGDEFIRTATNAGNYEQTLTLNTTYYEWQGGITTIVFHFNITPLIINEPTFEFTGTDGKESPVMINTGSYSTVFNGSAQYVKFTISEEDVGVFSKTSFGGNITPNTDNFDNNHYVTYSATNVGTYTITVTPSANFCWAGGLTAAKTYTFIITKARVTRPSFDEDYLNSTTDFGGYTPGNIIDEGKTITLTLNYDGKNKNVRIAGWDKSVMRLYGYYNYGQTPQPNDAEHYYSFSGCQVVRDDYYIQFALNNSNNYEWDTGTTDVLTYKLIIIKQIVSEFNLYQITDKGTDSEAQTLCGKTITLNYNTEGYNFYLYSTDSSGLIIDNTGKVNVTVKGTNFNNGGITNFSKNTPPDTGRVEVGLLTAGTYTITVAFTNSNYFTWEQAKDSNALTFTVIINRLEITLPQLEVGGVIGGDSTSVVYDGSAKSLKITDVPLGIVTQIKVSHTVFIGTFDADSATYTGAINATTYTVTLGFSTSAPANNAAQLNYVFNDGTYQHDYKLIINPKPIDVPKIVNPDGLYDVDGGQFSATSKTVTYTPDTAGRSILVTGFDINEVTYTWSASSNGSVKHEKDPDSEIYTVTAMARAVGTHTLTFKITGNYCWNTGSATIDTANKTFQLIVNKAKLAIPYEKAVLTDNVSNPSWSKVNDYAERLTLTYNGEAQGFTVPFSDYEYYEYMYNPISSEKSADNLHRTYTVTDWISGDRYVRFQIKDPGNYEWSDGLGDNYRYIYITLNKKTVAVPRVEENDAYWDSTSAVDYYSSIYINSGYRAGEYKSVTYNNSDRYLVVDKFDSSYMKANMQSSLKNLVLEGDDADPSKLVYYAQNVGTYFVYFTLIGNNYQWETGSTSEIYVFLTINKKKIAVPQISGGAEVSGNIKTVVYNGEEQHMTFDSWNSSELAVYSKTTDLQTDNAGDFWATNFLNNDGYALNIKLTNTGNYEWADGTTAAYKTYWLKITPKPISIPKILEEDDLATATYDHSAGTKTATYNGTPISITFEAIYDIVIIPSIPGGLTLKDNSLWSSDNRVSYEATNAGRYAVNFYLKSANYKWSDDVRYNNYKTLTLVINSRKAIVPTIVQEDLNDGGSIVANVKTVEYTGKPLSMHINAEFNDLTLSTVSNPVVVTSDDEWKATGIIEVNATNVGTYTFRFTLKSHFAWADGTTTNYKDLILKIEPKRLEIPSIEGYGANRTQTVTFSEDAAGNAVTQFMYLTDFISIGDIKAEDIIKVNPSYTSTAVGFGYKYDAENSRMIVSAANVGSYQIRIYLANTTNYIWANNTTGQIDYYLVITRKPIDIPKLYEVGTSKDSEGKDIEVLNAVSNNYAIYTYDAVDGVAVERNLRLTGVLNNILNYSCNSSTANNGDMVLSFDSDNEFVNIKASQVLHTGNGTTTDYIITISLQNTANYIWNDGAGGTGAKQFRVRINRKQITLPKIEGNNTTNIYYWYSEYNGQEQSITLNNYDSDLLKFEVITPLLLTCTVQGDKLYCVGTKDYGDKYVRLSIKTEHQYNYSWQTTSGIDIGNKDYHLYIQTSNLIVPAVVGNDAQQYAAKDYVFQYNNVLDGYKAENPVFMRYVLSNETYMHPVWDEDTKILTVTVDHNAPIGTYYVTFQLVNNSNNRWANVGYYNWYDQSRYIYLQKAQLTIPSIVGNGTSLKKEVSYNDANQTLILNDYLNEFYADGKTKWMSYTLISTLKFNGNEGVWDADNEQLTFTAMEVGTYTVRVSTNAYCTFTDGAIYKDYTLQINKAVYTAPSFVDDGDGTVSGNTKTIVYDFEEHTIVMQNIFEDININNKVIYWYDLTGYPTGTPDDSKLKITWDSKTNSATITAKYMRVYTLRFGFTDKAYKNSKWSTTTAQYIDYTINIARASLTIPTIVSTNLAAGESVSGVWKYTTYTGNYITMQLKDVDGKYLQWQDITSYAGVDDDSKAELIYDADAKILTVKAKYVRDYYIRITLKDTANSWWSNRGTGVADYALRISKYIHAYPTVVSGCPTSVVYTGNDVEFKLQNVVYGTDNYTVTAGTLKEVSWLNGVLTLSAKDVGTYTVLVAVTDTKNSGWNYYTQLSFTFVISKKALSADVSFSSTVTEVNEMLRNGQTSWASGVPVFVNVAVYGLNTGEGEAVGLKAYVYNANSPAVTIAITETSEGSRRYALPTSLTKGTYYVVIAHADKQDNYTIADTRIKFTISSDPAAFTENDLVWQYSIGGGSKTIIGGTHNTIGSALDLTYAADVYSFSITLDATALQKLNVRIVSYNGNTTATNYKDGVYCVTVTIAAYDATYYFPTTTYSLYYRINKAKFDLSGVKWDYNYPFTYDGTAKDVFIDGNTLPAGLSVSTYTGNTGKIDANEAPAKAYYTNVVFTVENQNYVLPVQTDAATYQGKFNWTCEWVINKAEIDVKWKPTVQIDEKNQIFNIPVLIEGAEKVTYTYQMWKLDSTYDEGGRWVDVAKPEFSPMEVTYRVYPKLTDGSFNTVNYNANYKLVPFEDEDLWHEFVVGGDQIPVMIYLLIYNGTESGNGKASTVFYYNGKTYSATWAKDDDEGRIVINSESYEYVTLDDNGGMISRSSIAPTNVGRYRVEATISYSIKDYGDSSIFTCTITHEFEIKKGTIDVSSLVWEMDHNGKFTYDAVQGKWLDQYKAEVSEFVYDGSAFTLTLKGQDSLSGIVKFTDFNDNMRATASGNYTARFVMTYDKTNWNDIDFDNFFNWSISKSKIVLENASWNYASPFTYGFNKDGSAIERTVELQNLPEALMAMVAAKTATIKYTGNVGTNAGDYTAKVAITTTDSNYEIVFPEVLSDTLNWSISKRVLNLPEQNGKWTVFDGKAHDLLTETCGADADWADFYDVSVRYSNDGITYASYSGFDGVTTNGYHACYYELVLKIKDTINTKNNENAVWENLSSNNQTVKVKVDKLVVTVTGWNGDYEDSTAMTDHDSIAAELLTYTFTDENGNEYTTQAQLEELKQLGGGIHVTVTPSVKAPATGFNDDISLAFIDENSKTYSYVTPYRGVEWLAYPTLTETTVMYDGNTHTFAVKDWDYYADYLELTAESAELTQTKAGTYVVEFRIKQGAQASWQTGDGSMDMETTVSLTFYIQTRTINLPSLSDYTFTGSSINAVENLSDDIMNYVTFTGVTGTNAGRYSAVFSLKDADSCMWSDTTTEDKTIVWNITQKTLPTPEVSGWTVFDGNVHDIVKDCGYEEDWNKFFDISVKYSVDGEEFNEFAGFEAGKKYTAYAPGIYEITFAINSGLNTASNENVIWSNSTTDDLTVSLAVSKLKITVAGWNANMAQSTVKLADGSSASNKFFEYIIKEIETDTIVTEEYVLTAGVGKGFTIELQPKADFEDYVEILYKNDSYRTYFFTTEKISITKPVLRFNSATFDGTPKTFEIVDWNTKYSKYLEINESTGYLTQTDAGTYEIVLSFKNNSVAKWSDDTTDSVTLTFTILELDIDKPVISDMPYTGSEIDVVSSYLATRSKYVEVVSGGKGTNADTYTVEFALKYPSSTKWSGGDSQNITLTWSITQNKLTEPANTGKWTTFDAANHDLLALCGVQSGWSNYYDVQVEYAADGVDYKEFDGTVAYNAGSYRLTFSIKSSLNADADNVVWSVSGKTDDVVVTIEVAKLEVTVIGWNENKNYSTVKLASGTIPSSVMSYRFTNEKGNEVTEAEVLASAEGLKFTKQLIISEKDNEVNVVVKYDSPELTKYTFVMTVHEMDIPVIEGSSSIVYDGKSHTFIIQDWDLYADYVEIVRSASDNLAQQDAGSYKVTLRIKDTLIATWTDGATADVTLDFEITQLVVDGVWDTSSLPYVFKALGTYPVDNLSLVSTTYTDKDGNVVYSFVEGETYTATVAIARSYVTNYKLNPDIPLTQTFVQPIEYSKIDLPTFSKGVDSLPYNGQAQTFQISRQSFYEQYMDISGSLTQTDAGTYSVTLTFKAGAHATWQDGSTDAVTLTFKITEITVKGLWDLGSGKITVSLPELNTAGTEYGGGLPADLITYTFTDKAGATILATDFKDNSKWNNNYYVSATISKNYSKNFVFASDVQKVFAFFVDSEGNITTQELKKLDKPVLINDKLVYNGNEQTFAIKNWAQYSDYLEIIDGSLTQINAGEYSVTIAFKSGAFAIWQDGGKDDVTLTFTIAQKELGGTWIFDDTEETQPYVDVNGSEAEKSLTAYTVKDADGNIVSNIEINKTYYITVSLKDSNYTFGADFESTIAFKMNGDGSLTEITVKKFDFPEFVQNSFVYDGTTQTFELVGYEEMKDFIEITGDSLMQAAVGTYEITVSIIDPTLATWANGTTGDISLTFSITARTTALSVDMPSMADEKLVYTGSEITFEIGGWAEKYDGIVELTGDSLTQTDAGTYSVTLRIMDTSLFIWENGKLEDVTLTFEIVKAKVEGEWLLGDEVPYFSPDDSEFGSYPEGMIKYTISDANGKVLEFKDTETCVTYYMTATMANGNFEFADGVQTTFAFRYTEGNVLFAVEVQLLDMPEFVQSEIEFDGDEHTFEVKDWAYLGQYLEMSGASLTQTKVGEYRVTFTITDTTLATWKNGTTRTFSLKFAITERTSGANELELPVFEIAEYTYDGNAHPFAIEGWAELEGKVELSGDSLTQTEVGTYTATLRLKNSVLYVWANGSDTVTVSFSVKAILLDANWTYTDTDVPYLAGVSLDIVRYEVTDLNGNAVDAYNTVAGVNYYVTAYITDTNYTFEEGLQTRFVYRFNADGEIIPVEKTTISGIEFVDAQIEFDGEEHTFEIKNWDYLGMYLEISGASLTQTEVGKYSVTFVIIDTTLASWENSTARSLTLKFEITERLSDTTKLTVPSLKNTEYTYDGSAHNFEIEGWAELEGKVELIGDSLTQTEVGTYTAIIRIKNSVLYVFANGSNSVTVNFTVKAISLKAEWVFSNTDVPYVSLTSDNARNTRSGDAMSEIIRYEITDYYGTVINADDTVAGVNYYITAIITDPNYAFEDGFETKFVYRISMDGEIIPVTKTTIGEVKFVLDAIKYDGDAHTFEIKDWDMLEPYIQIIGNLTRTEIGEYRVTAHIIDKSLATWENGTALDKTLVFRITEDEFYVSLDRPVIEIAAKEYNGAAQTFQISNWNELKKYVKIKEGAEALTKTEVGTYTITLQIYSDRFTWKTESEEGSKADVELTFRIGKQTLSGVWDRFNKVPLLVLNSEDLPEDMLVGVITDADGNVVEFENVVKGETYLVTYSVNEQYKDTYTLPLSMRAQYFKVYSDGNCELVDGFPEGQDKDDNTLIKVVVAVVVILVLFLVTVIVCFIYIVVARRKKAKQDAENAENAESKNADGGTADAEVSEENAEGGATLTEDSPEGTKKDGTADEGATEETQQEETGEGEPQLSKADGPADETNDSEKTSAEESEVTETRNNADNRQE